MISIGNLYVLDVTSGQVKQITQLPSLSAGLYYMAPMFSADGRSVLFTKPTVVASGADGPQLRFDIWTVPASGGEPTLVRRNARGVDVEPGGDSMAFVGLRVVDGQFKFGDLYIARSNGQDAHKLVDGQIGQARWSPDGSQIAYEDEGRNGLFVVDLATGETRQILDSDEPPEWVDQDTMIVDLSD